MKKKLLKQRLQILSKENEELRNEAHKSFWESVGKKPSMPNNYDVLNAVTDHLAKIGFIVKQCEHEFDAVERNKGVQLDYVAKCSKCGFKP